MSSSTPTVITIETTVKAPIAKVWECWNDPAHVTKWNQASPDWHSPRAENDVRTGGRFIYRMEAKDGSFGFDFSGTYNEVKPNEYIKYTMDDNRKVEVWFQQKPEGIYIKENFEAEEMNSVELQKEGWQSILDSFARYCEKA
ncbi:MAG: SRPBCC family protein [Chitinophagaceae bacterium]|nr:SRPBCC family protein [Chitinophagaceae bacterium]